MTIDLRVHHDFRSAYCASREIFVSVPPGYETDANRRYPVLYLHDGQNLFGGATSPMSGQGWQIDTTARRLIAERRMEPLILVGVPNNGDQRATEYVPVADPSGTRGGGAARYGRMLVEEIKPLVEQEYRTLPGPDHTGVGGSSFGALSSLYLGLEYPHVFGRLALLSLAWAWSGPYFTRRFDELRGKLPLRIWLDVGIDSDDERCAEGTRRVRDLLQSKGWVIGADLHYQEFPGAPHHEGAWAQRVPLFLPFLFPAGVS